MSDVISCSNITFLLINPEIMDHGPSDTPYLQKTVLDGRYIDVMGLKDQEIPDLAFKKMKEAYKPQKTQDYMLFPMYL